MSATSPNIPNGWQLTSLGDVLSRIDAGVSPQALARPAQANELGVLKVSAVTWNEFRPFENKALPENFDATDCHRVRRGDLLLSRANTVELLAAPVIADDDYPNLLLSDKTLRLVPKREVGHAPYLLRALRTRVARQYFESHATGTSGSMRNVSQATICGCPIMLPPLPEQRRIADILDRAESLRAKRRAAIARLDELTQAIFVEMFGDPVLNPKGWPVPKLGELLSFQQYSPRFYNETYSEEGIRIVRITDLNELGELDFDKMPRLKVSDEDREKYVLRPGDIIFARTGATVGKVALIRDGSPPCIAGAYFITMRFSVTLEPIYVRAVLTSPFVRAIVMNGSRQAAQQNFSGPGLRELPMPLPPLRLQQEFASSLSAVETLKSAHLASFSDLNELFGALQYRAFRGEL